MSAPSRYARVSTITLVLIACIVPTYYFPILAIGAGGLALRSFDIVSLSLPFLFLLAPSGWWNPKHFQTMMFWMLAFALSVAISTGVLFLVHRPDPEESGRIIRAILRLYEVLVIASVAINALRHVSARHAFNIMLLACAVLPAYSLYFSLTTGGNFTRIGSYAVKGSAELGIEGNYAQANFNELGALCAALGAGSAGFFLLAKTHRLRLVYLSALLLYTSGVVLTSSRSGLVAEGIGLVLVALFLPGRPLSKTVMVAAPFVLVAINARFFEILFNRFTETMVEGSHEYLSAYTRIEGMRSAWSVFAEHPFLGVGYAAFRLFSAEGFITPECYYLEVLADLGLVGAVAFCGLILQAAWRGWRLSGEAREIFIAAGMAPVVTLLASNLSGNNFFDPSLLLLFLIFLGFGVAHDPGKILQRRGGLRSLAPRGSWSKRPQPFTPLRS